MPDVLSFIFELAAATKEKAWQKKIKKWRYNQQYHNNKSVKDIKNTNNIKINIVI